MRRTILVMLLAAGAATIVRSQSELLDFAMITSRMSRPWR